MDSSYKTRKYQLKYDQLYSATGNVFNDASFENYMRDTQDGGVAEYIVSKERYMGLKHVSKGGSNNVMEYVESQIKRGGELKSMIENNLGDDKNVNQLMLDDNGGLKDDVREKLADAIREHVDRIQVGGMFSSHWKDLELAQIVSRMMGGGKKNIRVLTYNVYFKAMLGTVDKCKNNVCLDNIMKTINNFIEDDKNWDFVLLQEFDNIEGFSGKLLHPCKPIYGKLKINNITISTMTLINSKKYDVIDYVTVDIRKGEGRPMTVLKLKDKKITEKGKINELFLVNVHCPHYDEIFKKITTNIWNDINKDLNEAFTKALKQIEKQENIASSLANLRVIMGGDFNVNIKDSSKGIVLNIGGRDKTLYINKNKLKTCCHTEEMEKTKLTITQMNKHYDHILDSNGAPENNKIYDNTYPASDHLPVVATLQNN